MNNKEWAIRVGCGIKSHAYTLTASASSETEAQEKVEKMIGNIKCGAQSWEGSPETPTQCEKLLQVLEVTA